MAREAQDVQDEWEEYGFQYIEVWSQDNAGNPPDVDDLADWADRYGLVDIPVLAMPASEQNSLSGLNFQWERDMYIPSIFHLSPEMEVLSDDRNRTSPRRYIDTD